MEIKLYKHGKTWGFEIVSPNGTSIASSDRSYAHKRSALKAARKLAGAKLKVVAE